MTIAIHCINRGVLAAVAIGVSCAAVVMLEITFGVSWFWETDWWMLAVSLLVVVAGMVYAVAAALPSADDRSRRIERAFCEALASSFHSGIIKDRADLVILRNAVGRRYNAGEPPLAPLLEHYLAYENKLTEGDQNGDCKNSDEIVARHQMLKELIRVEREAEPFVELPPEERRILEALNEMVGEDKSVKHRLGELGSVVSARHRDYRRSRAINAWSLPTAAIGMILTVIFGLATIFSRTVTANPEAVGKAVVEAMKEAAVPVPSGGQPEPGKTEPHDADLDHPASTAEPDGPEQAEPAGADDDAPKE